MASVDSFLPKYDETYAPLLGGRARTFRAMLEALEQRKAEQTDFSGFFIVETGTIRIEDNWAGDGQATRLFDAFVEHHGGRVLSVDIDPKASQIARALVNSERVQVVCGESVAHLAINLPDAEVKKIDLLYLDSYDIDWNRPHPSALHHVFELMTVWRRLPAGSLVAVDDNKKETGIGKGMYVREFLERVGATLVVDDYQIIYKLP